MTRPPLTGRIGHGPAGILNEEVLAPQFHHEATNLLPWYIAVEKVLAAEYVRMKVIGPQEARELGRALSEVDPRVLRADPEGNHTDIAFALERLVEQRLTRPIPRWHLDRSRNDLQSCAQLMYARARLADAAEQLRGFGTTVHRVASATRHLPMPGHTHFQAAQVITPGFWLAAVSEQVLHTLRRLLTTYDGMNACPLGAGAMAGQELDWDRARMAELLGFGWVQPVALTAVASRGWALEVTAELSLLGVGLSRFATDLLTWSSGAHGFLDLPEELSGISSAMPQKKNFPVLERIRGRTAHLTSYHLDAVLTQRNTPYTNLVEVSKEAGTNLPTAFDTLRSVLRLFTEVVDRMEFRADLMHAACSQEYLGGFSLANALTMDEGVPWRQAQVIAGDYVVRALEAGISPDRPDPVLLAEAAARHEHRLADAAGVLSGVFDADKELERKVSAGSANPERVGEVLREQSAEYARLDGLWKERAQAVEAGLAETDRLLGAVA